MRLVEFEVLDPRGTGQVAGTVSINPDMVVAVFTHEGTTRVTLTEGKEYIVKLPRGEVALRLSTYAVCDVCGKNARLW